MARHRFGRASSLSLPGAAFIAGSLVLAATGQTPSPSATPSPRLAPYKERLAAAKSVKVETNLLGIELDSLLETARVRLDPLCEPAQRTLQAEGESDDGEHKLIWQLAKTDFASVYLKADHQGRITYIAGTLRAGKEIPFDEIGQVEMAPIRSDNGVVWDVVKPGRKLIRVVARGAKGKATSITLFVVKRPPIGRSE